MKRTGILLLILAGKVETVFAEQCKNCDPVKIFTVLIVIILIGLAIALGVPFLVFYSFNKFSKVKRKNFGVSFLTGFILNLLLLNLLTNHLSLVELNSVGGFLFYFFAYVVFCMFGYYISPKKTHPDL